MKKKLVYNMVVDISSIVDAFLKHFYDKIAIDRLIQAYGNYPIQVWKYIYFPDSKVYLPFGNSLNSISFNGFITGTFTDFFFQVLRPFGVEGRLSNGEKKTFSKEEYPKFRSREEAMLMFSIQGKDLYDMKKVKSGVIDFCLTYADIRNNWKKVC